MLWSSAATYPPCMSDRVQAQAPSGEVVTSSDPLALAKRVGRQCWRYATGLVVVLAVLGSVFRHSLRWGDFPTWTMAITTLLAFLAAFFAGLVAYELFKVETARDLKAAQEQLQIEDERAAQREADRRAQASKVTAWFDSYKAGVPREMYYAGSPAVATAPSTWGAAVRNASELPIFDVQVTFYRVSDPGDGTPWTAQPRYAPLERFRVIAPDHTRRLDLPQTVRNTGEEWNDSVCVVGIEFTDASGTRWVRDARAALRVAQ